ncbi:BA75_00466T0 [Komagataella pastoris]|uniref:BA75_00466T0 n=1 Tax=Komagataella pastoris TaxID=4922 RepID=A0A1B2J5G7_PICPA|nr:BA75_00466T0 [Komagataella pastoris]
MSHSIHSAAHKSVMTDIEKQHDRIHPHDHPVTPLEKPDLSAKSIKHYFATRLSTLVPKAEDFKDKRYIFNPFIVLRELTPKNWNFFMCGFAAWTWDAVDFFSVSLNVSNIAKDLDVTTKDVTWGLTLVLMLRSVGAISFGLWADRKGRKWPFVFNMILLIVLQIGLGFVNTYKQFLGVRAIFGIAMGAVFGNASSLALDDCPPRAKGIVSGIFQQGYAFGYLLVVVFQRAITDNSSHSWRALFWFSAGPPVLIILWRLVLPETDAFIAQQNLRMETSDGLTASQQFVKQGKDALRVYWLMLIYMIIMMAAFNFSSHSSQDLYPTLLTVQYEFGKDRSTVTNVVANLGAIVGGVFWGHMSNFIGRRLAVLLCCIVGGAFIYPWAFLPNSGINAGAFFLQFAVQGGWGVCPVHLAEMSPPHFRAFVTGTTYQLGNLASSGSSTILADIGERFPIYDENGVRKEGVYDYAKVMAIFMGAVFAFLFIVMLLGPERRGASNLDDLQDYIDDWEQKELDTKKGIETEFIEDVQLMETVSNKDLSEKGNEKVETFEGNK